AAEALEVVQAAGEVERPQDALGTLPQFAFQQIRGHRLALHSRRLRAVVLPLAHPPLQVLRLPRTTDALPGDLALRTGGVTPRRRRCSASACRSAPGRSAGAGLPARESGSAR